MVLLDLLWTPSLASFIVEHALISGLSTLMYGFNRHLVVLSIWCHGYVQCHHKLKMQDYWYLLFPKESQISWSVLMGDQLNNVILTSHFNSHYIHTIVVINHSEFTSSILSLTPSSSPFHLPPTPPIPPYFILLGPLRGPIFILLV